MEHIIYHWLIPAKMVNGIILMWIRKGPAGSDNLSFLGSAPYLSQFPSGETVLSYNKSSTFYMKMGDAKARNFGSAYSPFPGKGYWGTLNLVNPHQLVGAMPDTSNGTIMIYTIYLNHVSMQVTP